MTDLTCDVAVIGAGTAGLAAERTARRAGAKTLLIDDRFSGTTCASVGCMPSKLLIAAARSAAAVRGAGAFGIEVSKMRVDGASVMARVRRERDHFVESVQKSIADLPTGVAVQARASFEDRSTLRLSDGKLVKAKAVVIATGSTPLIPENFQSVGDLVLTNESLFDLKELPKSVAVIGGGPLGLELAQALARLDVEVELFDAGDHLAGLEDGAVSDALCSILKKEFPIHLGVEVAVERRGSGVAISTGDAGVPKVFERVLLATGRPPQLKDLGLEDLGLELDDRGVPRFDRGSLQCGDAPIFIAGDADADRPVLHEASAEGAIAGRNAACYPDVRPTIRATPLSITFSEPAAAIIGWAASKGDIVGVADYADQGRAKVDNRNAGIARIYAEAESGRLLGASLTCPGGEHLAHLLAHAIERGETAMGFLKLPIYHPTLEEGLKSAMRSICKQIGRSTDADRDEGDLPGV